MSEDTRSGARAVVGIGASAGGLGAFIRFIKALPPDSGMAFVLVQHLDPAYPSELANILSSATKMPVAAAGDGEPVRPDRVYVLPSDSLLTLSGGRLRLTARADGHPPVIDQFLTSLAADRGKDAIAVILSGSGSDGAKGVRAVKAAGGATFAQDPASAEHGDMPRNAIESGAIDYVMVPEEIAWAVLDPGARAGATQPSTAAQAQAEAEAFEEITGLLQAATGVNFRHYKVSTLKRRIERRLSVHRLGDLVSYAALLRRDAGAVAALYQEVLLHVTGFFRDPTALESLKTNVLPELLAKCTPDRPCRIWVPGCASGEEVYSIGICILEAKAEAGGDFPIQIFGTDLSDTVLDTARHGRYPATIAGDVSVERLERYFVSAGDGYQVAKRLREICTFSRHDITRDPPFSRIDLISCRNVLIYFDQVLQGRVMRVFHYALNPGGFLMLGPSETPGVLGDLFSPRHVVGRIHVRQAGPSRLPSSFVDPARIERWEGAAPLARRQLSSLEQAVNDTALEMLSSPGVVVSNQLDILQFRGRTAPWVGSPPGEPTTNLLKMVHRDLRVPVGRVMRKARKDAGPATAHGLAFQDEGREQRVTVRVLPVSWGTPDKPCFLVLFEALDGAPGVALGGDTDGDRSAGAAAELQRELIETRDYLQALIDEQDRVHAELQAAHEDALSVNEEFQSTNEELVTTKEEIQSINEELTTINEELRSRNAELQTLNADLSNVLESVEIPVILGDRELRVRRFSPRANELFQLEGRPPHALITDLELPIARGELGELCRAALQDERGGSSEVRDREGRWHELRTQPYRDADGRVVGVVLALVDIDAVRQAMIAATRARDYSAAIVEAVRHPMIVLDSDLRILSANGQFWRKFRLSEATTVGTRLVDLPGDLWEGSVLHQRLDELLRSGRDFDNLELATVLPDVGRRLFRISARQLEVDSDAKNTLIAIEDVSDRRLLEERLQQAAKLQAMGQIAGGVAHEINNQMQIAMGFGRDLLEGTVPGPSWRQDVEHILAAAARSADVTRSLLAFTRQQLRHPEFVTVDDLVAHMARLLPKILGPTVETILSLGAARRQVYADRAQLEQVFVNLALNARAAMPGGGRLVLATSAIEVDDEYGRQHGGIAIEAGRYVRVVVRDVGEGMDAATLGRIFEPFFTTKPVGQGSGLGMASVYGTVKQSGGYVWVDSRPGGGTTVTIDLPERTDKRAHPRRLSESSAAVPRGSETILVVDDEEPVRSWICRALETLGYTALAAADRGAALEILEAGARADLMLTDIIMPRTGGRELGALVMELRPGLRLLFMSGHTRHEMITRGLLDEHDPLLSKPFSVERLAVAIREALDARVLPPAADTGSTGSYAV